MKNLFNDADRRVLTERLLRLTPESARRWGKMSVGKMMCHLGDHLMIAMGALPVSAGTSLLGLPGLKQLVIYFLPWPKGFRTAPEMLTTEPQQFEEDRNRLFALIDQFVARGPAAEWQPHPLFGTLSGKDWGGLAARHIDHHLRQFGV